MKKRAVLFVGLGNPNTPFIDIARKMGFAILATNRNAKSVSLKKADKKIVTDGQNIISILNFVFSNTDRYDIQLVYCGSDLFVTKEVVSCALGLPHNPLKSALAGENKALMRKLLEREGIPIPSGGIISTYKEALKAAKDLSLPVIVKPTNRLGALGVTIVNNQNQLEKAFEYAQKFSEELVIEEFLTGTLHDVNAFFLNGKFYPAGISDKKSSSPPYAYVEEVSCPSILSNMQKSTLYSLLEQSTKALGVVWGPVKADAILTQMGFKIMDIALRFHGPLGSVYCLPIGEGISPWYYFLRVFTGRNYCPSRNLKFVIAKAIIPKEGKVVKFKNLERVKRMAGIDSVILSKKIGDHVTKPESNYDISGYVIITSRNRENAIRVHKNFAKIFQVETKS